MADIKHGSVTVTFPDHLTPPEEAGKLSTEGKAKLLKARRGVGLMCDHMADVMEQTGERFMAPREVTPASLREAGRRAEDVDKVILELEVVLEQFRQANLLFDDAAYRQLIEVNRQIKAQLPNDPGLKDLFAPLIKYFSSGGRAGSSEG